ncbi:MULTISPECIES: ABC transporter substrate-binding protein [Sporosarcina]|uniref:ABC transporter substrate-binding protein n=1 Tax=Sporosarcina TaxID=1569 RepID=UPI00129A2FED|nr:MULTISPECIES: ABC transporter substrate-binding protein [Sporosarcina]GKV64368.1 diguanylate phosphodiesterase [Sporosarcina sp. NCCP-2331]GLB55113.1 diguanylate phosphodiesterase [Sporosarcina sp. NCCP-2378]
MRSKTLRIFLLGMALLLVLSACSGKKSTTGDESASSGDSTSGEPQDGGVLQIGLSANPQTLDPVKYTGVYESQVMRSVADTLVVYSKDLSEIKPSLATEWEISDDLLVYTFKLRDDIYFQPGKYQDGRKMTAEDVKYSLERSAKESVMNRLRGVTKVEVTGENEVEVHLEKANAALLAVLTDAGNVIVPKEEVEGWGESFGANLVGTGPFMITDWQKDQQLTLDRFDKYWGEKPHVDSVKMKVIADTNMMTNALRSGDIDIAMDVKGQNRALIEQDENLDLLTTQALSITYLDLNNKKGPTADPKVREAIYKATNVDELVQGVSQWGGAVRSYLPLPPGSWGYDEALEDLVPTFEPEKAKELLAEAGYPDGFETEIYVAEARVPYATIFQNQMKENLNIDVEIKVVEWGTYSDTVSKGNAPMSIGGWSWYPDPYFFLYQLFHTDQLSALGNGKGYENPEVDKLLNSALSDTADQEERAKLYQEALKIILKDVPRLEIDVQESTAGVNKKVQGFDVSPDNSIQIVHPNGANVWLKQ